MSRVVSGRHESHRRDPAHAGDVRLERWHRRALYATGSLLTASGALWLLFHYFLRSATPWGEGPHPLEAWWLRLHGLAAMLTLLALGSLLATHVGRAWRRGRNRASGGALAAALVLLIATGYALYYFAGEESRPAISLVHWVFGAVAIVLVLAHVALGRGLTAARRRPRRHASPARRAVTAPADEARLEPRLPVPRPADATPGGGDY